MGCATKIDVWCTETGRWSLHGRLSVCLMRANDRNVGRAFSQALARRGKAQFVGVDVNIGKEPNDQYDYCEDTQSCHSLFRACFYSEPTKG